MVRALAMNVLKKAASGVSPRGSALLGMTGARGFASSTNDKIASLRGKDFMSTAELSYDLGALYRLQTRFLTGFRSLLGLLAEPTNCSV